MLVRPMQEKDIPIVVELTKGFCDEMGYPYEAASVVTFLRMALINQWYMAIAEDDSGPIGFCGAMTVPHIADFSVLRVIEFSWHSLPSLPPLKRAKAMILMLESMENFAVDRGLRLSVSTSEQYPALSEFMEKRQYTKTESVYVKEK